MTQSVLLANALAIPLADWQALIQGKMIATSPWCFISLGQSFALYPEGDKTNHADFWARCEFCKSIDSLKSLQAISRLTIWEKQSLESRFRQRGFLFLACLRVYQLPKPIKVVTATKSEFLPLDEPAMVSNFTPVLDDPIFSHCLKQLEELRSPVHPELEELESKISQLAYPKAEEFLYDLKTFLGLYPNQVKRRVNTDLDWIESISKLGNRSKDLDEGKSNYQAGTDFENIVHRSLKFLGFIVDEAYKGGAGGLDLFCSEPYPLVGECKAGKKIPSGTSEELIKLGGMRLGRERFLTSAKLIIGPGSPTPDVLVAAAEWKISIINSMSLQKLVELKAKYPGSIDLVELKKYLEPGQIDARIDEYIEKVQQKIELRIHILQIVKKHVDKVGVVDVDVNTLFGVYCGSTSSDVLTIKEFYKILIELSSPLTGFLGRRRGNDGSDRFYYLRDLSVE